MKVFYEKKAQNKNIEKKNEKAVVKKVRKIHISNASSSPKKT